MVAADSESCSGAWQALADWPLQIVLLAAEAEQQPLLYMLSTLYPAAQITTVCQGAEAVQWLEARCPDLLLIAAPLIEMTATEVIQRIRQITARLPIVLLTDTLAEARRLDQTVGVYGLVQPVNQALLYQVLKALNLLPPVPVHFDAAALLERLDGDLELARSLIIQALAMLQSETLPTAEQLDAESRQDLRQQAHRIKGMAANLSFLALRDYAQTLELQARLLEQSATAVTAVALRQSIQQLAAEMALLQKIPLWPGEDLPLQV